MNREEASYMEVIKFAEGYLPECDTKKKVLAALEKQLVPKKPNEKHYEEPGEKPYIKYVCPVCGKGISPISEQEKAYQNRYCHKCGQNLLTTF